MRRALLATLLCALILSAAGCEPPPPGVRITIENDTQEVLEGLLVRAAGDSTTTVPALEPGEDWTGEPVIKSEGDIVLLDTRGNGYILHGYYSGNPGGTVSVAVEGIEDGKLDGTVVNATEDPVETGRFPLEAVPY